MNYLFIVSDEGYGHIVRQSCIANELASLGHEVTIQTRDPASFARKICHPRIRIVRYFNLIRLRKSLGRLDVHDTIDYLRDYETRSKKWREYMKSADHVKRADAIITDLVEEAALIKKSAKQPAIAVSHFTWHWLFSRIGNQLDSVSSYLEESLANVDMFLFPPFSKDPLSFPNGKAIELIVRKPAGRAAIREKMNMPAHKKLLLFVGGATTTWKNIFCKSVRSELRDYEFVSDVSNAIEGTLSLPDYHKLNDYVNAADLVISRGGYGTISEAAAYGVRHLIIEEERHPETIANARLLSAAKRAIAISRSAFEKSPQESIETAMNSKLDLTPMPANGHLQVIQHILNLVG